MDKEMKHPKLFVEKVQTEQSVVIPKDRLLSRLPSAPTPRTGGQLKGQAFGLDHACDWIIGWDDYGKLCLVPLEKE